MIFVSFRITSCTAQDNVASAVRKSTAEKVSPGLGRKDWGFETESPARRSPFFHIFSLGSIELSSKHIRRVSQNMLMPTCINHPVYVSESGQFNGLTVVDEFCANPSKAESKRFLEANHLWKLYAEEVYPLTYPQMNRAKYLDFNSGVVLIVSHGDNDRRDDLNRCFSDIRWYQWISNLFHPFSAQVGYLISTWEPKLPPLEAWNSAKNTGGKMIFGLWSCWSRNCCGSILPRDDFASIK